MPKLLPTPRLTSRFPPFEAKNTARSFSINSTLVQNLPGLLVVMSMLPTDSEGFGKFEIWLRGEVKSMYTTCIPNHHNFQIATTYRMFNRDENYADLIGDFVLELLKNMPPDEEEAKQFLCEQLEEIIGEGMYHEPVQSSDFLLTGIISHRYRTIGPQCSIRPKSKWQEHLASGRPGFKMDKHNIGRRVPGVC